MRFDILDLSKALKAYREIGMHEVEGEGERDKERERERERERDVERERARIRHDRRSFIEYDQVCNCSLSLRKQQVQP